MFSVASCIAKQVRGVLSFDDQFVFESKRIVCSLMRIPAQPRCDQEQYDYAYFVPATQPAFTEAEGIALLYVSESTSVVENS